MINFRRFLLKKIVNLVLTFVNKINFSKSCQFSKEKLLEDESQEIFEAILHLQQKITTAQ